MFISDQEIRHLPAPAKLNLFLHVVGRRADGYHLIESVFQLIDWQDTIHLSLRHDGQISREDMDATQALPPHDLCTRAAQALQQAAGCSLGAHIQLEKQIPAQAGMGGGSSDAATCLIGLNRLWNLHLPLSKLEQIGPQRMDHWRRRIDRAIGRRHFESRPAICGDQTAKRLAYACHFWASRLEARYTACYNLRLC
jgi:hypothetical protein